MGSPTSEVDRSKNETQHLVTVSTFLMSKYEITFEQYDMFCIATGRKKPGDKGWRRERRPVINVSWEDATAFADWSAYRDNVTPSYRDFSIGIRLVKSN